MADSTTSFAFDRLPTELQRAIFLRAAENDPTQAKHLVTVARRVNEWLQPRIYRSVVLGDVDGALFVRTMRDKPAAFFATNVKHLCLTSSIRVDQAKRILKTCDGVAHLALWVDFLSRGKCPTGSVVSSLIACLPLKRLSIEYRHLLDVHFNPPTPLLQHPGPVWYHTLTHLALVFWAPHRAPDLPFLDSLHSLTHLSIGPCEETRGIDQDHLASVLLQCRCLKMLLVLLRQDPTQPEDLPESSSARLVYLPYPDGIVMDWEASCQGRGDVWTSGEEELLRRAARRKGKEIGPLPVSAFEA